MLNNFSFEVRITLGYVNNRLKYTQYMCPQTVNGYVYPAFPALPDGANES